MSQRQWTQGKLKDTVTGNYMAWMSHQCARRESFSVTYDIKGTRRNHAGILLGLVTPWKQEYGDHLQKANKNTKVKIITLTKFTYYAPKTDGFSIKNTSSDRTCAVNQSRDSVICKTGTSKKLRTATLREDKTLRQQTETSLNYSSCEESVTSQNYSAWHE